MILQLDNKFILNMAKVPNFGKIMPNMKVIGEMEWLKGKVLSIMLMVTYTQVNSIKIEQMALENMFIKMDKSTLDSGKMICKTAQEKKS